MGLQANIIVAAFGVVGLFTTAVGTEPLAAASAPIYLAGIVTEQSTDPHPSCNQQPMPNPCYYQSRRTFFSLEQCEKAGATDCAWDPSLEDWIGTVWDPHYVP